MSASLAGLSKAFDSTAATMRLAALTASSEDVDELSKTFKIARPTVEEMRQAAPRANVARVVDRKDRAETEVLSGDGSFLLVTVLLLVLLGIALIFAF